MFLVHFLVHNWKQSFFNCQLCNYNTGSLPSCVPFPVIQLSVLPAETYSCQSACDRPTIGKNNLLKCKSCPFQSVDSLENVLSFFYLFCFFRHSMKKKHKFGSPVVWVHAQRYFKNHSFRDYYLILKKTTETPIHQHKGSVNTQK